MKFGLVHRLMTDALATLGLLSLLTSGELDRWMSAVILGGLIGALAIPETWRNAERLRRAAMVGSLALLATQLGRLFIGGDILALAVEFAAGLQVVRLATRRGAAHDQQIILLALVHLVAGTVLGGGLAYGLCFVGFLIVAPGALVLSHLRREVEGNYRQGARDRTGLPVDVPRILRSRRVISKKFLAVTCSLSVPIFLFTAVLFVLFPRVGLSLLLLNHSRSTRMIGFSDRVDLGGVGKLRSDPAIALRVHFSDLGDQPPPRLALYLRGTAFDYYDGRSWSRSLSTRHAADEYGSLIVLRPYSWPTSERTVQVDLEPISPPVIFLPPDAVRMKVVARGEPLLGRRIPVFAGPEGEFKYTGDDRGLRYEVYLRGAEPPPPERMRSDDRERYLRVPSTVGARIAALARSWAGDAQDPLVMARRIEQRLRGDYRYDLESPSGAAKNPLEHFLFESRSGHCEFYSTAMAMMLRTLGVPTRNVTGFIGGTYNRFGRFYAVRQGDAHSWVEVYLDGYGWQRFDPTPPAGAAPVADVTGMLAFIRDIVEAAAQRWNRHVVGYDLDQQVRLLRNVRDRYNGLTGTGRLVGASSRRVAILLAGLMLVALGIYFWRRHKTPGGDAPGASPARAATLQVVTLYRSLEAAMATRGVPRVPSTPPMAHARALVELGHPIGAEVMELTQRYLEVRYGGATFTETERREYARRVRVLYQKDREDRAAA